MDAVILSASSIERRLAGSVELDLVDIYLGQMGARMDFVNYETPQHLCPA